MDAEGALVNYIEQPMGDTDVERFKDYFPTLLDEIQEDLVRFAAPSDAIEWIRACLEYNVPGGTSYPFQFVLTAVGKMNRGIAAVKSARILGIPDKDVHQAIVLGWCIEIVGRRNALALMCL